MTLGDIADATGRALDVPVKSIDAAATGDYSGRLASLGPLRLPGIQLDWRQVVPTLVRARNVDACTESNPAGWVSCPRP